MTNRCTFQFSAVLLATLLGMASSDVIADPLRDEARRLAEQRQFPQAIGLYQRLLGDNPRDSDLLIEAARVNGFADRNTEAAEIYEQALRAAPARGMDILPSLAWQSLWAKRTDRAIDLFRELVGNRINIEDSSRGLAESTVEGARLHVAARNYAAGIRFYEEALAMRPAAPDLQIEYARALGYADRNADAASAYRKAIEAAPQRRNEWLAPFAWQTLWSGDGAGALALFSEAQAKSLDLPETFRGAAQACTQLERHECAILEWRKFLALRPNDAAARKGLGRSLFWLDHYEEAEAQFEAVLASDRDDREARLRLAQIKNFSGMHRAAVLEFDRIAAGNDEGIKFSSARAFYWAGFPDLAAAGLSQADDADAQWLRDYRIGRELKDYAWGGIDWSNDADRLRVTSPTIAVGLRRTPTESFELKIRKPRLSGYDQPLQSAYSDLVRSDNNGILQAMSERLASVQTALSNNSLGDAGAAMSEVLGGTLVDKFGRVIANQRVNDVSGLGTLRDELASANAARVRNLIALNDNAGLQNFLNSADGRAYVDRLQRAASDGKNYDPNILAPVDGAEVMASYSWRVGDVRDASGTLWPSVSLGVRDYAGWQTIAWRIRARYVPADRWFIETEVGNGVVETIGAIRNRVTVHDASASVRFTPAPQWDFLTGAASLRFDDDNRRNKIFWRGDYVLSAASRMKAGVEGHWFNDSMPWNDVFRNRGYYNPKRYTENRLFLSIEKEAKPWAYYAKVGVGKYRETDALELASTGRSSTIEAWLAYDMNKRWQLRANAGASDSGAGSSGGGAGYWRRYVGAYLTTWFQ